MKSMTHQQIEEDGIIERYVLHQLNPEDRLAFQEHFFSCDECFEQTQLAARFVAGARKESRDGVLAAGARSSASTESAQVGSNRWWPHAWVLPAVAAIVLITMAVVSFWAVSLRRENQRLASQIAEQRRALEAAGGNSNAGQVTGNATQDATKALAEENSHLRDQLAAAQRQNDKQLAELRQPDVNVPVRNIYPTAESERSTGPHDVNRVQIPRGTRAFVLILSDYKRDYSSYRLEIRDAGGRLVSSVEGLKPDPSGDLSVMLNRAALGTGRFTLRLFGDQQQIAEYLLRVD
jgi:hypothetical protein